MADSNFEVDAIIAPGPNAKKNELPTGGANLKKDGGTGCIDWAVVNDSKQPDATTGSNDNSFGQGTSENDAVPTIVSDSIPPNKSDLLNFGVYEELAGTKTFVALYWARINSPQGTTNMDFELNQNSCDASKPQATTPPGNICSSNNVTPRRESGDKLLIFNLSSGGTSVAILIRNWNGSAWVDETTLNSSQALGSINYDVLSTVADNDDLGVLDALTFGEVVVDFQALLGSGATCGSFGSVYLKSRSSDSFNAEMKDFIAPKPVTLTNCTAISTSATSSVVVGNSISDTATLSNANSPTGHATFDIYSDAACTNKITTLTGSNWTATPPYTSTATYLNPAVGTYYWIAHYAGDANNSAAHGACGDPGETSTVTKASPTLGTTPSAGGEVGIAVLNDTATLTNAYNPTGSITFKLFDPDQTCPTADPVFTQTVALSGNSATTTLGPTATKAGTWRWVATWPGDANNNGPLTSGCAEEEVTVTKASPSLSTLQDPSSGTVGVTELNDGATLSGGYSPSGSIVFSLWDPEQPNCNEGPARYSISVALSGGTASTDSNFIADKVGTWNWTASYAGDGNNNGDVSTCGEEPVDIDKAPSTISTSQFYYPNDTATIGGGGGGTVDFKLYGPFTDAQLPTAQCSGTPKVTVDDVQVSGVSATTNNTTQSVNQDGWYLWLVEYSGDGTHDPATSVCGDERFKLSINNNAIP